MSHIWPPKNCENRSVTLELLLKMHILKTPTLVCQNSENIYLTFVAYSSKYDVRNDAIYSFQSFMPKKSYFSFVFIFGSKVQLCKQIYISTSDVYL